MSVCEVWSTNSISLILDQHGNMIIELNPDLDNSGLLARFGEIDNPQVKQAVKEMETLLEYATLLGCSPSRLVFEPSLARGLDYYTGAIYEVVMTGIFHLIFEVRFGE